MSVYSELKAAGCELDNHESDLYVVATPTAQQIIYAHPCRAYRFIGSDGRCWWDVSFMFEPWWEAKKVSDR